MTIRNIIIIVFILSIGYTVCMYMQLGKQTMIDVPYDIKCAFQEKNCEENDITAFTLCMSGLYFLIGYKIPDYYITVFALSIGSQILLQYMGHNSSFIVDPLANLTGYAIGSILSPKETTNIQIIY